MKLRRSFISLKVKIIIYLVMFAVILISAIYGTLMLSEQAEILREQSEKRAERREIEKSEKYYRVEEVYREEPDEVEIANGEGGGTSGLNLMLINTIETEGYVKEYLSLARDLEEGKLDDYKYHASVSQVLGTQIGEGSTLLNGTLPQTYLPWDSNENPYWGANNPYGVPASEFNLKNATRSFYTVGGGSVPLGAPDSNEYRGPFQQHYSKFGNNTYKASKISKTGVSDEYYFPDQLAGLSYETTAAAELYPDMNWTADELSMLTSAVHNAGQGSMAYQIGLGVHHSHSVHDAYGEDAAKSVKLFLSELCSYYDKYTVQLNRQVSDHLWKFIALIMLLEDDWNVDPNRALDYITGSANQNNLANACTILHPEMSTDEATAYVADLIAKQTKEFQAPQGNSNAYGRSSGGAYQGSTDAITPLLYKIREETSKAYDGTTALPIVNEIPMETAGHIIASAFAGNYMYGTMLKYAGVGVDPTNPETYLNTIPEEEWKPGSGGITDKVAELGYSVGSMNANRQKMLDYAMQFLGYPYCFGGNGQTIDESAQGIIDGLRATYGNDWSNGYDKIDVDGVHKGMRLFDCSSFIQTVYKEALGIDLPRFSNTQVTGPQARAINVKDAKPGDLGGNVNHVVIFLANTPNGVLILDQANPNLNISIRIENNPSQYTWATINGVD